MTLTRLPAIAPAYLRALTQSGRGLAAGDTMPRIEARIDGLAAESSALARYNRVCGYADGEFLPPTYPHVMAFPVQMQVLTHRSFPLGLLGLVHVGNEIRQRRATGVDESLSVRVLTGEHREKHNGIEFDLVTEVFDADNACVWRGSNTFLSRRPGTGTRAGGRPRAADEAPEYGRSASWQADTGIGRRYARATGDINPIHLSALSAKLFGFPRAIAHGMWLKARTVAEIAAEIRSQHFSISVAFKKPVLLPGRIFCRYQSSKQGIRFVLTGPDAETVYMTGALTYI